MWPLPQIRNDQIHVVLHGDRVVCMRFVQDGPRLCMKQYRAYDVPLGSAQLFFNITALQVAIEDFITTFDLRFAYIHMVLAADLIDERLMLHNKSDASLEDLLQNRAPHMHYRVRYIGPYEDAFLYDVCIVAEALMLQLKMFHCQLPVHLRHIISPLCAQIEVYKQRVVSAFSQARLAQDIDQKRVLIPMVCSPEVLRRSVYIAPGMIYDNYDVVHAWGSFLGAGQ